MVNVPKLRFDDCDGEWSPSSLGDYFVFRNGINATKEQYGKGYKFINVLDIINNSSITHDKIIGSVDVSETVFKRNIVEYGDVLFQRSSETRDEAGQSNVYLDKDTPATFGGFVIRGKGKKDYDPVFFNYLLKSTKARKEITTKSNGSTRYNVGQETLSEVELHIPAISEQHKIAAFLTAVDNKIEQLTQKEALLKQYKKGVMQKIFSQEIRFKADDGSEFPKWEMKLLGKIFNNRKEINHPDMELLSVTMQEGVKRRSEIAGKDNSSQDKSKYVRVLEGDIVYNSMRMWQGASGVSLFNGIVSPAYTVLQCRDNVSPEFFGYFFKTKKLIHVFQKNSQGLTPDTWNLKYPQLSKIKVFVATFNEQIKIVSFLKGIDEKLYQASQQIQQVKTFKKGLLQQMFV